MYKVIDYVREEYCGVIAEFPVETIEEAYDGEIFDAFRKQAEENGHSLCLSIKDDLTGEIIDIEAEDYLSKSEMQFLAEVNDKEYAKRSASDFTIASQKVLGHRIYKQELEHAS